ncbi:signal recognition particle-docking protein FtsY [Aureimonas mangrovi]|uniref:signal recognition particle-docking protein FtsY n=1 Tax=Aureimonas mangrovi TaxID=2758041 RepID=UPI001FE3DFDA|nr:signal recognition particle-docking protein FtsY [Aureimonas mangrovi]
MPTGASPGFDWLDEPADPAEEPKADFSFLDEDAAATETVGEEQPLALDEAQEALIEEDGGAIAPAAAAGEPHTHADDEESGRDEFAWLDAPLEPEEEGEPEADPQAGSPDRLDMEETPLAAAPGIAPVPAPPPAEGWRLREAAPAAPAAPAVQTPWFQRLREGLSRSSGQLSGQITSLFTKRRLDEETLQDFEDVLIQSDLGVETATKITDRLSEGRFGREITGAEVRTILAEEVEKALAPVAMPLELDLSVKPHVILVVGVNGTGKTTTIGKLAAKLTRGGMKVTLAAGDTFRAAAVEQLKIWGERTNSAVVAKQIGADAAGLAFEAYDEAVANGSDVLIIDTAGRLQNKAELMAELEKIVRVLQKRTPDAPHTVLQTLDATTGQNALQQVEIFRNVAGVNGLVMTKLDGTARGGILVAIAARHKLPVFFVGVGEGIDDLEPFRAKDFADAIAGRAA